MTSVCVLAAPAPKHKKEENKIFFIIEEEFITQDMIHGKGWIVYHDGSCFSRDKKKSRVSADPPKETTTATRFGSLSQEEQNKIQSIFRHHRFDCVPAVMDMGFDKSHSYKITYKDRTVTLYMSRPPDEFSFTEHGVLFNKGINEEHFCTLVEELCSFFRGDIGSCGEMSTQS